MTDDNVTHISTAKKGAKQPSALESTYAAILGFFESSTDERGVIWIETKNAKKAELHSKRVRLRSSEGVNLIDALVWEYARTQASSHSISEIVLVIDRAQRHASGFGELAIKSDDRPDIRRSRMCAALASQHVFVFGDALVEVVMNAGRAAMVPIGHHRTRDLYDQAGQWFDADGAPCGLPEAQARAFLQARDWRGIRTLRAVVETPTLRPDLSVLQTPGYDSASGLFYAPLVEYPPVPHDPSAAEVARAKDALADILDGFRFEDEAPGSSSIYRAAALSACMTLLARYAIDGPVPAHMFSATQKGTGKDLLAGVMGIIGMGRIPPACGYPRATEERSKAMLGMILAGTRVALYTNVDSVFGDPDLAGLCTSGEWTGRVLGTTNVTTSKTDLCVWASSNGASLYSDMSRRTVCCRQNAMVETPHLRDGFKHQLPRDALTKRGELTWAALTILRAYHASGEIAAMREWGTFGDYSRVVRAALAWAGYGDTLKTSEEISTEDASKDRLSLVIDLVAYYTRAQPLSAGQIISMAFPRRDSNGSGGQGESGAVADQLAAVRDACKCRENETPSAVRLGFFLKRHKKTICNSAYLESVKYGNATLWRVVAT